MCVCVCLLKTLTIKEKGVMDLKGSRKRVTWEEMEELKGKGEMMYYVLSF